jgi:hypothetical protein
MYEKKVLKTVKKARLILTNKKKKFENRATINRGMIFQSGVALFDHLGVKGLSLYQYK